MNFLEQTFILRILRQLKLIVVILGPDYFGFSLMRVWSLEQNAIAPVINSKADPIVKIEKPMILPSGKHNSGFLQTRATINPTSVIIANNITVIQINNVRALIICLVIHHL